MAAEQGDRDRRALHLGWLVATFILVLCTAGLTYLLSANYPGDAGPVIGAGAADKLEFALVAGPLAIAAAALCGLLVLRSGRHRS
jgi:hypothetical protein